MTATRLCLLNHWQIRSQLTFKSVFTLWLRLRNRLSWIGLKWFLFNHTKSLFQLQILKWSQKYW